MTEKHTNYTRNWVFNTAEARDVIAWLNNNPMEPIPAGQPIPDEAIERLILKLRLPGYQECYECGKMILMLMLQPPTEHHHEDEDCEPLCDLEPYYQGEGSLCIDFRGGYGEFFDSLRPANVLLCHDCCVRLMEAIPNVAARYFSFSGHPSDTETSCCKWGWRTNPTTDETEMGDGAGGWRPMKTEDPHPEG